MPNRQLIKLPSNNAMNELQLDILAITKTGINPLAAEFVYTLRWAQCYCFANLHLAQTFFNVNCLAQTFFFGTRIFRVVS